MLLAKGGNRKPDKPTNRLGLTEFLGCLVRISFLRANPKHGQYDNKAKLVELPGCLKKMLEEVVIPNAKQDMSGVFRKEIADFFADSDSNIDAEKFHTGCNELGDRHLEKDIEYLARSANRQLPVYTVTLL